MLVCDVLISVALGYLGYQLLAASSLGLSLNYTSYMVKLRE